VSAVFSLPNPLGDYVPEDFERHVTAEQDCIVK